MENSPEGNKGNDYQEQATVPVPEFAGGEGTPNKPEKPEDSAEQIPVTVVETGNDGDGGETVVVGTGETSSAGEKAEVTRLDVEYEDGGTGTVISANGAGEKELLGALDTAERREVIDQEIERLRNIKMGGGAVDTLGMSILSKSEQEAKKFWDDAQAEGKAFQEQYDEDVKNGIRSESGRINRKTITWTLGIAAGVMGIMGVANLINQPTGVVETSQVENDGSGVEQGEKLVLDTTGYVALETNKSAKPYAENAEGKAYEKQRVPGGMAEQDALKGLGQKETLDVLFGGGEIADEDGLGTMPAMLGTFLHNGLLSQDSMNRLGVDANKVTNLKDAESYAKGLSKEQRLAIAEALETEFFEPAAFSNETVAGGNYTNQGILLKEQDGKIVDSKMIQSTINSPREAKKFELNGKSVYFLERCANIVFFVPPGDVPKFDEDTAKKWEDLHEDITENNKKEELQEDTPTETPPPVGDTSGGGKDWSKQNKDIVQNNKPETIQEKNPTNTPPPVGDTSNKNTNTNTTNTNTNTGGNTNTNTGGNTVTPPVENGMGGSTKAPEQGAADKKANEEKAKEAEKLNNIADENGQVPKDVQIDRFKNLE